VRLVVRILAGTGAVGVVVVLLGLGDFFFNGRQIFYALLGRDKIVQACSPMLVAKLKSAGFEPAEVMLGDEPQIAVSGFTGTSLQDSFTFRDGAAGSRVDGILACIVKGNAVTVDFRTSTTPERAS